MTRLIRINCCEECPHYRPIGEVCRNPEYFDEFGRTISRSVRGYDEIPGWCPLDEESSVWSKEIYLGNAEFVPIVEYVGNDEYVTYPEGEPPGTLVAASNDVLSELIDRAKAGQKRVRIGIAEVPK